MKYFLIGLLSKSIFIFHNEKFRQIVDRENLSCKRPLGTTNPASREIIALVTTFELTSTASHRI